MVDASQRFSKEKRDMSSLAATQGIPFSAEYLRSALESAAIPGFTGSMQVNIGVSEEAAKCVMFSVLRRETHRKDQQTVTRQALPDPTRKKPVDSVIDALKSKLFIRTVVMVVEAHYVDGVLQNWTHLE